MFVPTNKLDDAPESKELYGITNVFFFVYILKDL